MRPWQRQGELLLIVRTTPWSRLIDWFAVLPFKTSTNSPSLWISVSWRYLWFLEEWRNGRGLLMNGTESGWCSHDLIAPKKTRNQHELQFPGGQIWEVLLEGSITSTKECSCLLVPSMWSKMDLAASTNLPINLSISLMNWLEWGWFMDAL